MTALSLHGVTVNAGGRAIVDRASLTVPSGHWAALIGPNGAGKSTTLRAIAGLLSHRGTVTLDGADAAALSRRERARRIAVVPQTPVTPADMSVREYILLGRTPHISYFSVDGAADRAAADRAIRRLDLETFADRTMATLSGGERQRAVLARALAQEAEVLLLDEPTSALDLAHQQQVLELVDCLRAEEGLTVIAAMHDLTSVSLFADAVHLLSGGRLVASGSPAAVLREDILGEHFGAVVRIFAHDGAIVVAPVRHEGTHGPGHVELGGQGRFAAGVPVVTGKRTIAPSLVVVNTGDGKGKSTAAFGVMLRALARNWQVAVIQFVKSDRWKTGEEKIARDLGVDWLKGGDGFTWESKDLDQSAGRARAAWQLAKATIAAGEHKLVVLDEITYPINFGWIEVDDVVEAIRRRPEHVSIVATGRSAPAALIEVADTVTEMVKVHHAYDSGIRARRGIDY